MLQNLGVENPKEIISRVNDIANIDDIDDFINSIVDLNQELYSTLGNDKFSNICVWGLVCYMGIGIIELSIDDIDDFINSIVDLNQELYSTLGNDKFSNICVWGLVCYMGIGIIELSKEYKNEDVLELCKFIKKLGENYSSICDERITSMYFNFKSLFDKDTINEEFIIDYILPLLLFKTNIYHLIRIDDPDLEYENFLRNFPYMFTDVIFLFYFCIYKNPQYIVNLGFILMSNSVSHEIAQAMFSTFRKDDYAALIQYEYEWWRKETGNSLSLPFPFYEKIINLNELEAMFSTFRKDDYAALIQYEYEWWRKETGNSLSLPFPFYEKIINLNELGVIDYELAGSDIADGSKLPDPNLCPLPKNSESNNNSGETIFNSLKKYCRYMNGEDVNEAGASFRNNHLSTVITAACRLKDRYSVYGFASVLFDSKYFNWADKEFNKDFVMYIANIFNIDSSLVEGNDYNQSKSREKAKQMLSKKEMSYLNVLMK